MGKDLVRRILISAQQVTWPQTERATAQGKHAYAVALEKVDDYRGDSKELAAALRTALTGESRPYAMATLAYILLVASREPDGSYAPEGLEAVMHWLEQAQELEPDDVDINFIEVLVYVCNGRYDDARLVLNYLRGQQANNYYLHLAEIAYWEAQEDVEKVMHWYDQAIKSSNNVPQKMRLRVRQGDFYLRVNMYDQAQQVYQEAVHFDKTNPLLWHKLSLIFVYQQNFDEAGRCNQRALQLRDFPAAREVEEMIKRKSSTTGMLGRLFGRS